MDTYTHSMSTKVISSLSEYVTAGRGKGQLRSAKPKTSGAAQLKRAATKRNNIRKHG